MFNTERFLIRVGRINRILLAARVLFTVKRRPIGSGFVRYEGPRINYLPLLHRGNSADIGSVYETLKGELTFMKPFFGERYRNCNRINRQRRLPLRIFPHSDVSIYDSVVLRDIRFSLCGPWETDAYSQHTGVGFRELSMRYPRVPNRTYGFFLSDEAEIMKSDGRCQRE
ncbi:hypothetical protein EVAR_11710_1 [Eumeta japonica]|uniref:Uncharacterized protein n=1 Tax=Eumeta variegata TaxID=151549 RepID=A0A4C1U5Q9_EUMVA|nr:hypothetical protein EVAR_11710_1 [Eumeta japonica]